MGSFLSCVPVVRVPGTVLGARHPSTSYRCLCPGVTNGPGEKTGEEAIPRIAIRVPFLGYQKIFHFVNEHLGFRNPGNVDIQPVWECLLNYIWHLTIVLTTSIAHPPPWECNPERVNSWHKGSPGHCSSSAPTKPLYRLLSVEQVLFCIQSLTPGSLVCGSSGVLIERVLKGCNLQVRDQGPVLEAAHAQRVQDLIVCLFGIA